MEIKEPMSRYQQVAEHLRRAIASGEYEPGRALPSEAQLSEAFGMSRPTMNKAVKLLAAEGLVTIEHGRGAFVREKRPVIETTSSYVVKREGDRALWTSETRRQGLQGTQQIREVTTTDAPGEVAAWLGLEDGSRVVVRRRVLLLDGAPVQLADSYYPADLAEGTELSKGRKLKGGTVAALERLGVTFGRFHERLSARMPTREEKSSLSLPDGVPVLRHVRVSYDTEGRAVEAGEHVMNGERHILAYDLPAEA